MWVSIFSAISATRFGKVFLNGSVVEAVDGVWSGREKRESGKG